MKVFSKILVVTALLVFAGISSTLLPDIDYLAFHGSNYAEYLLLDKDYGNGKASFNNQAFYDRLDASLYIGSFEIGATANIDKKRIDKYTGRFVDRAELSKLYLGVDIDPVYVQVGTFEKTYQYGLTFYAVEDRDLNRENYLKGALADINPVDGLEFSVAGGVGEWDGGIEGKVRAGEMSIYPLSLIGTDFPLVTSFDMSISHLHEPYVEGLGSNDNRVWSIGASATHRYFDVAFIRAKHTDFMPEYNQPPEYNDGRAWYFSASGNIFDFASVGFQYKDYQNYLVPFTQPPPVSVFEKSINGGVDEVGIMFNVSANPLRNLHLNWALSLQKMHDVSDYGHENKHFAYEEMTIGADLLEIIPRTDLTFDIDYLGEHIINHSKLKFRPGATYYITNKITVKGLFEYEMREEWVMEEEEEVKYNYKDYILELGASWAGNISGSVYLEQTDQEPQQFDRLQKKRFIFYEVKYHLSNEHQIAVGYGSLRGGEVCSGGVCRYEIPFEGVRVSLTSVF